MDPLLQYACSRVAELESLLLWYEARPPRRFDIARMNYQ